ncbi:MAG: 23S rRNA (uracil(1939)-C(5))-methyltransferase RlmD [Mogibacterium sp.]|nr:23S rRNA (uracil(1939)-C(5))-methyltransferase RlmD [Mogibacterium sp.]
MEKNQIIELRIEDMLDDGRAFGRYEGCAVFVSGGAVPGDDVKARVAKAKKSSAEAAVTEIVAASPDRIHAECTYAGICGGCTMQALSYEAQKKLKEEQVRAKLKRLGGLEDPKVNKMIGADTLKYYRNKAVFAVGPHGEVGFLKGKTHFVMDIDDCLLQTDAAMVCADALRAFLRQTGVREITQLTVRTAFGTGEVMAVLETDKKDIPKIEKLVEMFDDAVYSLSCDEEGNPAADTQAYSLESVAMIHKGKCRIIAGKPTINEEVITEDGRSLIFEISPQSFYQVNPEQMERLYDKAAEYADLKGGETVLDLYCGAGTIGLWLLENLRKKNPEAFEKTRVIGIESVKPAVLDANRNSVINGVINTRYICGKAEEELPGMMGLAKLYKWNEINERVEREPEIRLENADVAVLDPPRAGCAEPLLAAVVQAAPDRIVYVSCDPGTLARDIKYLTAHGYEFIEATPVDQFPWTSHIEVVVLLSKGKIMSKSVRVEFPIEDMNTSGFQFGATYQNIADWIWEEYGLKVSRLYISQIKRKCGLEVGDHYNKSKEENQRVLQCPPEKEEAIIAALRFFQMI